MVQIAFVPFSFSGLHAVGCAFTSRQGGVSTAPCTSANLSFEVQDDLAAVRANREGIKKRLGLKQLVDCTQVHADTLNFELQEGEPCTGDGLATSTAGIGLMIKTADCQPVLIAHENGRFVAALHIGWRANVLNFIGTGVQRLCTHYSCKPSELFAVRGPSLGPKKAEFTNFDQEFGAAFKAYYHSPSKSMNLWQLTQDQLMAAGLLPERIHGIDMCTMSMPDVFFSYRREKNTGRQAGIIWLKN